MILLLNKKRKSLKRNQSMHNFVYLKNKKHYMKDDTINLFIENNTICIRY